MTEMSMNWLDSRVQGPDLGKLLQPHTADLQLQGQIRRYAGRDMLADSSAPSWLFGNIGASADFGLLHASAQAAAVEQGCQQGVRLPKEQRTQHQNKEPQDEALHGPRSGSSGSNTGPVKPAGAGKRSEAWRAKNRKAQQRFRAKQKVPARQALAAECMQ